MRTEIVTDAVVTAEQMDAALLAALDSLGGEFALWSDIRRQLPEAPYWAKVESLVRLTDAGAVDAIKVGGSTVVGLPFVIRRPARPRPARTVSLPG